MNAAAPALQHLPPLITRALEDLAHRLAARFGERLGRLVLFGSYARGDWGTASDVDVLVRVNGLTYRERREIYELAWDLYCDHLVHLAPLAMSAEEYETIRRREYRIAAEIAREGILL